MLKKIIALILAVMAQQFTYCCAADVALAPSYYILKYEYEDFLYPITASGASEQELLDFFADVETELKKVEDISRDNFETEMKDAVLTVSTFREHRNVSTVIHKCYGDELTSYMDTGKIPEKFAGVYDALVRAIFDENTAEKTALAERYEEYKKISETVLAEYTDETVAVFEESMTAALSVLKNKNATDEDIAKALGNMESAYGALEKKPISTGTGGGGSRPGTSLPAVPTVPAVPDKTEDVEKISFEDLTEEHWSYTAVTELAELNVINGFEDGTFRPDKLVTREEFAKMICVAFELPKTEQEISYSDVDSAKWYYEYVQSITSSGIMQGMGNGTFGIGKTLLRQDFAVMAKRLTEKNYLDKTYTPTDDYTPFEDLNGAAEYAREAIEYVQRLGIINGVGANRFAPVRGVTRAEAAQLIYSLVK